MKVSLIIDGNFLLYKNVFILKNINRVKQDLKELLINDIKKLTTAFHFDNIYFVSDSKEGNWRKQIYKEYKGNRSKDENIDWEFVYKTYLEFKDEIKNKRNIKFLELGGLEGDDLIAHTVFENNKKGNSNVIVASDIDINQVLTFDLNKKYINIQWNYKFSDERVYLPENYQLIINELSNSSNDNIFELDNSSDFVKYLEDLINRTKIKAVITEEMMVCKIIQGDTGDNIKSCVAVKDGKINNEGRGIAKDGAKTVYNLYKEIHPSVIDIDSDTFINNLADVIIYYKKIKDPTAKNIIKENLIFNRKMMILNPKYMPEMVYENMKNYFNDVDSKVVVYEIENLEEKMENDDFFNPKESIPEQFNMDSDGENFDPDTFWNL